MALESATYISQLVPANPPASDPIAQAASHLNLIKTVLQDTFPKANAPITATVENLNNGTPVGVICMWSGAALPAGWALCNGAAVARSDGTGNITPPDLRDRFIVGAGYSYGLGGEGGSAIYALSTAQLPSHSHSAQDTGHNHAGHDTGHTHGVNENPHSHTLQNLGSVQAGSDNGGVGVAANDGYSTGRGQGSTNAAITGLQIAVGYGNIAVDVGYSNIAIGATGSGAPIDNRPPFYALYYIMKV